MRHLAGQAAGCGFQTCLNRTMQVIEGNLEVKLPFDLKADAATVVGRVTEERVSRKKIQNIKVRER